MSEIKICPPHSVPVSRETLEQVVYTYAQKNSDFSSDVSKRLSQWGYKEYDTWQKFKDMLAKITDDQLASLFDNF